MESTILDKEIIENTAEKFKYSFSIKSGVLYSVCVVSFICLVSVLPFIAVSITATSPALIRPTTEISMIKSPSSGRIKESFIQENQQINKGDILYTIESEIINEKEKLLHVKKEDAKHFIADVQFLIQPPAKSQALQTSLYQQAYFNYKQKLIEATTTYSKVKTDYNRNLKLHREKVIADAEFENYKFALDKAQLDIETIKQSQLSQWQNELRNYTVELQDIESQLGQLTKEKENLIIKAPISGSIQNVAGIYPGSMVFANHELAQISPDTNLIIEAYVSPSDIGLLRKNMKVRFQVTAFNYNQWGLASETVIDISNDVHIIQNKPVFKVKCSLEKDFLQLKSGYKGYLKKGMTLQARFMVTERTLWQLLYDKNR